MNRMSNVKSLRELGVEFGMPNASKREIAMEVIRRARRLGVMTSELMKRRPGTCDAKSRRDNMV